MAVVALVEWAGKPVPNIDLHGRAGMPAPQENIPQENIPQENIPQETSWQQPGS